MMGAGEPKSLHRVNLHLWPAAIRNDSRFMKQAQSILSAGLADEVVLLGQSKKAEPLDEQIGKGIRLARFQNRLSSLPKFKLFGCLKYGELFCREVLMARRVRPSIIHCHSLSSLPAAVAASAFTRVPMIYDARELETETNGLRGVNQAFARRVEKTLIRHCDAVLCVADSIADWYARAYHIPRPFVVRNIPDVRAQSTFGESEVLRARLGIPREALVFIYCGGLYHGRRVEQMIRVFQRVRQDRHVVFLGFGPLEGLVKGASAVHPNIHFLTAVPPSEVLAQVACADVGIVGVENSCLSYHLSLPNKLFEYLLAGIPFLAPDYPEMRRVLNTHHCGWVVGETEEEWREAVEGLDKGKTLGNRKLVLAARKAFSWKNEEERLVEAYRKAIGRNGVPLAA